MAEPSAQCVDLKNTPETNLTAAPVRGKDWEAIRIVRQLIMLAFVTAIVVLLFVAGIDICHYLDSSFVIRHALPENLEFTRALLDSIQADRVKQVDEVLLGGGVFALFSGAIMYLVRFVWRSHE